MSVPFTAAGLFVVRLLLSLCVLWLCAVAPAAALSTPPLQLSAAELAWRKGHPPLRAGVFAGDHMPVEGWVAGRAEGIGPDYVRLLASRAGLRVSYFPLTRWTPVAFHGADVAADFDLLVGQPILPGPSSEFAFLRPFATGRYVVVVRRDQARVRHESDLATARIVVERSFVSTSRELESRYPHAVHLRAGDGREALAMVARGEADAYVGATEFRTRHLLRHAADDALVVVDTVPIAPIKLGLAVNVSDPVLLGILRKAEATISAEELDALRQRWGVAPSASHGTPPAGLTLDERVTLARLPTLRVGFEVDRPPYSFLNEHGKFDGLAADYIHYLRDALGFDVKLIPARDWTELQALAKARKVDIIAAAMPGDVDGHNMLFTRPYERFPEVIVAAVNGPPMAGPEDLAGRRVAVRDEPSLLAKLREAIPSVKLVPVASNEVGLAMAADGRVDAYVGTLPAMDAIVRDRYAGELRVVGPTGVNREFAIGIDKQHADLLPLFDRVLEQVGGPDRMRIRSRWIAGNYQYGLSLGWVLGIVFAATAVTSAFAFAYLRTRREVLARRQAEARLVNVTRTLPVAVFEVRIAADGSRAFTYAAGDTLGTIGLGAASLIADATVVAERIHEEDQARIEAHVAVAIQELKPIPRLDFRVVTDTGIRWIRTAGGLPRRTGAGVEWSGYWVDVTDSHEQATALHAAVLKAEREVEARSSFLAMMSHEIRTPMAGIVSWLELVADAGLPDQQASILEMVMESASALQQILDDILDFSRIDSGRLKVHAEEVDLRELLDGVVGIFASRASAKGLRLHNVIDSRIAHCHIADALRIRQVLSNLLSNAVKFTDEGHVEVNLEWIAERDGRQLINFSVADTGPGMNTEQMARLFEPFSQVGAGDPALLGGSGLGLTICKRLARLMGGDVFLASQPDQGTTATLQLELPLATATPMTAPFTGKRVLLGVADPMVRRELANALASLGFAIVDASLQAAGDDSDAAFDLVLADSGSLPGTQDVPRIQLERDPDPRGTYRSGDGVVLHAGPLRWRSVRRACAVAMGLQHEVGTGSGLTIESARADVSILVVEDHDVNRRIVARQVERLGYRCGVAANGEDALAMLSATPFDLILTDCHMPRMDGYALTRRIREGAVPGMSDVPVIALSAGVLEEQIQRCRDAGMDDFLSKPILIGPLGEAIARNLPVQATPIPAVAAVDTDNPLLQYLESAQEAGVLLQDLLQSSHSDLARYDALIAVGDMQAARDLLHRMRGALLLLGVQRPSGAPTGVSSREDVVDAMAQLQQLVDRRRQ